MDILNGLLAKVRESHGGAPVQEQADELLDRVLKLKLPDRRAALYPAVLAWVRTSNRGTRRAEAAAQAGDDDSGVVTGEVAVRPENPAVLAMKTLLAGTCYVEGHGMVRWGAMTPELHQLRALYLTRVKDAYVAGVDAAVQRHLAASALLTGSGYATLDAYVRQFGQVPEQLTEGSGVNVPV